MKTIRLALAAFAALTLAACFPPTTINPVGSTTGHKPDPMLVGLWRYMPTESGNKGGYFHFLPRADGTIDALFVQAAEPNPDWGVFKLTCGKAGANRFVNAQATINNGKIDNSSPPELTPLLYRFDAKGQLLFYLADESATNAAIKAGKLKGKTDPKDYDKITITDDPKALDKFMASPAGTALFIKPFLTLKKME